MRIAIVDKDKCKSKLCGWACINACPGVKMGEETIVQSEGGLYPRIDENLCSGCGLCTKKCPFKAIKIINIAEETGTPSFQYSDNSFRLYGFVLPKEKSVVGIIGVNGIGKSTALDLLRGHLRPNFGKFKEKISFEEIKKQVRGQEIQNYMEKIESKSMKFSHKMQNIDALSHSKDSALALLEQCDEKGIAKKLASEFGITNFQGRKLNQLSGGELQLVAIACALSRDADVYCIDEPSSYLDVSMRLKVASAIREAARENSVVLVEHDLALLDYLSDFIHVTYGEKGAYGVVSHLKSSKNGVNEYLHGFLKEENTRFRNYEIKFEVRSPVAMRGKMPVAINYSEMKKRFPGFELGVDAGEVRENEVIGILGANGIGKSTFVKMLAGLETPDEGGGLASRKKISYKPQYLKADYDGTCRDLLRATKGLDGATLAELREKLDLPELEDKNVKTLSGGELQRLAIALAISTPADLYLFDEPSAFLDVEQRLNAATLLKKVVKDSGKNAFVIDHDVLFVDSVSDRLVVFEGMPSKRGHAPAARGMREGMNSFLSAFGITFRRDEETGRPRANKQGSQKDAEQKQKGEYYYSNA